MNDVLQIRLHGGGLRDLGEITQLDRGFRSLRRRAELLLLFPVARAVAGGGDGDLEKAQEILGVLVQKGEKDPAATVREGDAIEIVLGERFRRVVVSTIPAAQAAKELARAMYIDETPVQAKVDVVTQIFRDRGTGRPTKKERREMDRLRR